MRIRICLLFLLSAFSLAIFASEINIGTPIIKNFSKRAYQGGSQNWDMIQGANGKVYFANNNGLLEFDGKHWALYPLPNNSVVRSVYQTADGKIYVGGFHEFGYFSLNKNGVLHFTSLYNLLEDEDKNFDEIWKIHEHADGLVFQSYEQLIFFKDGQVHIIKAPNSFQFSYLVDNNLYINDRKLGLMRYAMGQIFPVQGMEALAGIEIWEIISYEGKMLIATASKGIFIFDGNHLKQWDNPAVDYLMRNQVYSLLKTTSGDLVFGTIQDGLLICKKDGSFINLNLSDGLQNNTILTIGEDYLGNLWLGTDYGIDYVENSSPLLKISQNYGLSAGYAAYINDKNVYFGTNQGVFFQEREENGFVKENAGLMLLEKTKGQVWFLNEVAGELICGHTNGTFSINNETISQISDIPGGWYYLQVPGFDDKMIGGCYTGLMLFDKKNGSWKFSKKYPNFEMSSRSLAFESDGSLWMTHGYIGAYHIFFTPDYDSITHYDFYPLNEKNLDHGLYGVVNFDNSILFLTNDGFYEYDKDKNTFEKEKFLNERTNNDAVNAFKIDTKGNIWYFNQTDIQVLRLQEDGNYTKVKMPFKSISGQFVNSFEFVYPYNESHVFIALEDGFALYLPQKPKNYNYSFQCYLDYMMTKPMDSLYYFANTSPINITHQNNNIEFGFSANDFQNSETIEFSSFLVGYDENWITWNTNNRREFTNLYEGDYVFKLKARNMYGTETEIKEFEFKISPPLYRSLLAYILYAIVVFFLIAFTILFIRRRFELAREKSIKEEQEKSRQREERLQREALEAEKEVIRMRNDQLRKSMKQKNKELANATYQMVHKNETLINLKEKLRSMIGTMTNEENKQLTRKLIKIINKDIDSEKQWEIFETHFENVHEEFLKRLKSAYPDLTPREMKLCAYLRMNISSKEISVLMNISTRGVEIARYRLRKKLQLNRDTNLVDFIISF
jgi:ligand-binding sensor domain-containing protein/DNA-binding CsgD family transcriptional regulator/cell division protein FtsB